MLIICNELINCHFTKYMSCMPLAPGWLVLLSFPYSIHCDTISMQHRCWMLVSQLARYTLRVHKSSQFAQSCKESICSIVPSHLHCASYFTLRCTMVSQTKASHKTTCRAAATHCDLVDRLFSRNAPVRRRRSIQSGNRTCA